MLLFNVHLASSSLASICYVFYIWLYFRFSRLQFLAKRRPSLVYVQCILAIFITWLKPIYIPTFGTLAKLVLASIRTFLCGLCVLLTITRWWLLYYDYKKTEEKANIAWLSLLFEEQPDWYTNHETTLGDFQWLATRVCPIGGIFLGIISGLVFLGNPIYYNWTIYVCIFLSCSVFVSILYVHADCRDSFFIHAEIRGTTVLFIAISIGLCATHMIGEDAYVPFGIDCLLVMLLFVAVPFVVWKNVERRKLIEDATNSIKSIHETSYTLTQVLASRKNLPLFMRQLVRELSIENMLFIAEVIRYKQSFYLEPNQKQLLGWNIDIGFPHADDESFGRDRSSSATSPLQLVLRTTRSLSQLPRLADQASRQLHKAAHSRSQSKSASPRRRANSSGSSPSSSKIRMDIVFPPQPLPVIRTDTNDEVFYDAACGVYKKFISLDAKYQINLDSARRKGLEELFEKKVEVGDGAGQYEASSKRSGGVNIHNTIAGFDLSFLRNFRQTSIFNQDGPDVKSPMSPLSKLTPPVQDCESDGIDMDWPASSKDTTRSQTVPSGLSRSARLEAIPSESNVLPNSDDSEMVVDDTEKTLTVPVNEDVFRDSISLDLRGLVIVNDQNDMSTPGMSDDDEGKMYDIVDGMVTLQRPTSTESSELNKNEVSLAEIRTSRPKYYSLTAEDMLTCFDDAAREIFGLMQRDTFSRFRVVYPVLNFD